MDTVIKHYHGNEWAHAYLDTSGHIEFHCIRQYIKPTFNQPVSSFLVELWSMLIFGRILQKHHIKCTVFMNRGIAKNHKCTVVNQMNYVPQNIIF